MFNGISNTCGLIAVMQSIDQQYGINWSGNNMLNGASAAGIPLGNQLTAEDLSKIVTAIDPTYGLIVIGRGNCIKYCTTLTIKEYVVIHHDGDDNSGHYTSVDKTTARTIIASTPLYPVESMRAENIREAFQFDKDTANAMSMSSNNAHIFQSVQEDELNLALTLSASESSTVPVVFNHSDDDLDFAIAMSKSLDTPIVPSVVFNHSDDDLDFAIAMSKSLEEKPENFHASDEEVHTLDDDLALAMAMSLSLQSA